MADPERIRPSGHVRLNFTWKIILMAIVLLAVSQILGTLISVSTFETLLLKTLTTKYEILGKDLKRRIEHALKFGKPLDQFIGMDKLIEPIYHQTEDIDEIMIFDHQGMLFFSSKRIGPARPKNASQDDSMKAAFLVDTTKTRIDLPIQYFSEFNETTSKTQLYKGKYYVLFSIAPSLYSKPGMLALTFHQSVLDLQKQILINSAGKKLLLSLVMTAAAMVIMIHLLFTRPAHRQAKQLVQRMTDRTSHEKTGNHSGENSMHHLYKLIETFQTETQEAEKALCHTLHELSKLNPDHQTSDSIHRIQLALKGKQDETD